MHQLGLVSDAVILVARLFLAALFLIFSVACAFA